MKDETQRRRGRETKLTVAALVAALAAFVVFAPFASGAADPVATGSTTIKLNTAFFKKLKKSHVKLSAVKPGKVKGKAITLPIKGSESSLDPTTGGGVLVHKGGFKLTAGKKHKVVIKNLVLNTTKKTLTGKVGKKKVKICAVSVVSLKREGFGAGLVIKKLTVTKKAAKLLNKSLDEDVFKANKSMGSASSAEQPLTVTITGGNGTLTSNASLIKKLSEVEVKVETISPTTVPSILPSPVFAFPITGGALSPTATAGTVETGGGLRLVQELKTEAEPIKTTITLANIWVDFTAHTATVEVSAVSNAKDSEGKEPLNLGNLGRSSIADVSLTGAAVSSDSASHTITVQNASATLQPVSAEVLEGFVKVYQGYWFEIFVKVFKKSPEEAKVLSEEKVKEDHITAGEGLGSFSLTAQTQ